MKKECNKFILSKYIIFIIYIFLLIYVILLKNGQAIIIAKYMPQKDFVSKINSIQLIPFKTISQYLRMDNGMYISVTNILGNIISFSPLGFLLPKLSNKFDDLKDILLTSFLISFSFEIIQLQFSLGACDIDDIILNVLGGYSGFIIHKFIKKYLR